MKVVPVGDHVVVKRLQAEQKTAGGIVLPDSAGKAASGPDPFDRRRTGQ